MQKQGAERHVNAGLDSFAALNVMEHMSNLAGLGHTVIASIHQPRSAIWEMFDKVPSPADLSAAALSSLWSPHAVKLSPSEYLRAQQPWETPCTEAGPAMELNNVACA